MSHTWPIAVPEMSFILTGAARWIHRTSGALLVLGAVATVAMILLSAGDVLRRNLTGTGITASIQLNEMLMVAITFCALAATQKNDGHVSVDVVTSRINARVSALLHALGLLFVAALIAWATWTSWGVALDALHGGEVSIGIVNVPTWPARFLVSLGLLALTAELVVSALQSLVGGQRPAGSLTNEIVGGDVR